MIAFVCKQCGMQHSRPESQAGTLIFCACGQANRVPWADEPTAAPLLAEPVAPVPILDAEPVEAPPPPSLAPDTLRRPGRLLGKINPRLCLQHREQPFEALCAACQLPFCARCVVELQGQYLCGPCKNFRLARLGQPRRVLPLAVLALVVALCAGPVAGILSLAAAGLYRSEGILSVSLTLCVLALLFPSTALGVSGLALARLETRDEMGGRGLAASGASAALVCIIWCVTVAVLLLGMHAYD